MALDPRIIPATIRPLPEFNPDAAMESGLKVRATLEQQRNEKALQSALAQHPDDPEGAVRWLTQRGYGDLGMKLATAMDAQRTKRADADAKELETTHKKSEYLRSQLLLIDPAAPTAAEQYAQWRAALTAADPQAGQMMPPTFDPATFPEVKQRILDSLASVNTLMTQQGQTYRMFAEGKPDEAIALDIASVLNPQMYKDVRAKWRYYLGPKKADPLLAPYGDDWEAAQQRAQARGQKPADPLYGQNALEQALRNKRAAELGVPVAQLPDTEIAAIAAKARELYGKADDRPRITVNVPGGGATGNMAEEIADAIIAGQQPPDLKALYRYGAGVRAALARKGFNLAAAQSDWNAMQRHISTLNGPQQTRLRQATQFTYDSLDIVEDLAKEWKGSTVEPLNSAKLALARRGLLGQRAQSVATRLEAQVNDLVSELGTVYKGGNSSTDESLKLAAGNLRKEWSEQTLLDNIGMIRKNLRIRLNSLDLVGAVGTGENRYAEKPPPDKTLEVVRDPKTGKLVEKQ